MDYNILLSKDEIKFHICTLRANVLYWIPEKINFEYLSDEAKEGFDNILRSIDNVSRLIDDEELYFYCHKCETEYPQSKKFIEYLIDKNVIWWHCPICGYQVYLEEAYKGALNGRD